MTIGAVANQIIVRLKQRAQGKPGSRTARQRQEEAARNARVNKMLISMVVIFGTSWFPINLINLAADTVDLSMYPQAEGLKYDKTRRSIYRLRLY